MEEPTATLGVKDPHRPAGLHHSDIVAFVIGAPKEPPVEALAARRDADALPRSCHQAA